MPKLLEPIQIAWFIAKEIIAIYIEKTLFSQQWYRKFKGGKWQLLCHNRDVFWHPKSDFIAIMSNLDSIVDVIQTEDWTNEKI